MKERELQTAVFEFLSLTLPPDCVAFCIPNGDGRMTRAPGALAGIPDICLIYRGRPIFIELKSSTGELRRHQSHVHDRLTLAGSVVALCRSVDDVEKFLKLVIPLRGGLT